MMPHPFYSLLVAVLISGGVALAGNEPPRLRLYRGVYVFFCCLLATLLGGWTMYLIHG